MNADWVIAASICAKAALKSMAEHLIAPTPQNFAIWYEYHLGDSPELRRSIDIIVSNRRDFDERLLHELYEAFFTPSKEQQAFQETSQRVQETLHEVLGLVNTAHVNAKRYGASLDSISGILPESTKPLALLIERLMQEAREMASRSQRLGLRLKQSARKIETLERTLDDVRREAIIDGLTGVANRRGFDAALRELAGDAMNSGEDLSLLLLDVDHFKKFNDTWGHQTGDEALRLVARTLCDTIRGQDRPARYGGEEFAVILPHTPLGAAATVGDNIRRAVERQVLIQPHSEELIGGITVSVGGALYELGEPLVRWINRADEALYQAKGGGRNRVVTALRAEPRTGYEAVARSEQLVG